LAKKKTLLYCSNQAVGGSYGQRNPFLDGPIVGADVDCDVNCDVDWFKKSV